MHRLMSRTRQPMMVVGILALVTLLLAMAALALGAGAISSTLAARGSAFANSKIHPYLPSSKTGGQTAGRATQGGLPPRSGSGNLTYYGGHVEAHPVSYLIFVGPSDWGTSGSPSADASEVESYFANMGHTQYENLLTQYYDVVGSKQVHISNTQTVGGIFFDPTNTYDEFADDACTASVPTPTPTGGTGGGFGLTIEDSFIQFEVGLAIQNAGWPADTTNATYYVYTPSGYAVGYNNGAQCSGRDFCAYHSYVTETTPFADMGVAYAAEPYPTAPSMSGLPNCYITSGGSQNGDSLVNTSAHEQFESITDPYPGPQSGVSGWVNSSGPNGGDVGGGEIGDECAYIFPTSTGSKGINPLSTTIMSNNKAFLVQTEYSNASHSCQAYYVPKTAGVYHPASAVFSLRNSNSGGSTADLSFPFGFAGTIPIVGDWTKKGYDSVGAYNPATGAFYLKNTNTGGPANTSFVFGPHNSIPIVGDWNGDGYDTIGVYYPPNSTFYLRNSNSSGNADIAFTYGFAGAKPIAGDWTGKGYDSVGVYNPANAAFYLKNTNAGGPANISFYYGPANATPLAGDWAGSLYDGPGSFVPSSAAFYLRSSPSGGSADFSFYFGAANDVPVAGLWTDPGAGPVVS